MKTIVAPVDFSPVTGSVVAAAAALATPGDSTVVLLHVVQPSAVVADYGLMGSYVLPVLESMGQSAAEQLDKLKRRLEAQGLGVATAQVTGASPSQVIATEARRRGADYVVMGSHGHTGLYDLLIGSTTSGVLKRSACPVVIVPAQKGAKRRTRR